MKTRELRHGILWVLAGALIWGVVLWALLATLGPAGTVAVLGAVIAGGLTVAVLVGPTRPRRG